MPIKIEPEPFPSAFSKKPIYLLIYRMLSNFHFLNISLNIQNNIINKDKYILNIYKDFSFIKIYIYIIHC